MEKRRVVITGMGAVTPIGKTAEESWAAAKAGVCGIDSIRQYDTSKMKVKLAGEVKDFQAEDYLERREARRMDRFTQFAMAAAAEALEQSGLDLEREDAARCGVAVSSGIGGMNTIQNECLKGAEVRSPGHVHLSGGRLRGGKQRRGRRLPPHPGRLCRGHGLRRRRVHHRRDGPGRIHQPPRGHHRV